MCNSLFGRSAAKRAAKEAADAQIASERRAAADAAEAARSNQIARENVIARDAAVEGASQFLDRPMGEVDVDVAVTDPAEIDPATGRRRPTRAAFMSDRASMYTGLVV